MTGWDFVGDSYNADPDDPAYQPTPHPDPDPDDCHGHGTHVAGIIGANGEVTGVAPNVKFGAYRVFGCEGSTTDEIMLAAMERVVKDDMDVLNMSIGDAFNNLPGSPTAEAADELVKKGVVVVASAGNDGASGLWSTGAPSVGDRVISVASFDNIEIQLPIFTASPDDRQFGYDIAAGAPKPPTSGSSPLAKTGTPTTTERRLHPDRDGSHRQDRAHPSRDVRLRHQGVERAERQGGRGRPVQQRGRADLARRLQGAGSRSPS